MASVKDSIVNYFQESYQELRKVTWPTRHRAVRLTLIVLGFCVVATSLMGVLDLAFNQGYHALVDYAAKVAPAPVVTPPTTPLVVPPTQQTSQVVVNSPTQSQQVKNPVTTQSQQAVKPVTSTSQSQQKKPAPATQTSTQVNQ